MKIFVDLDGVLANFITGLSTTVGMPFPYINEENYGKRNVVKLLGISKEKYNYIVNKEKFWFELEPIRTGMHMLSFLEQEFGIENIHLLTSPPPFAEAYSGKFKWINYHLPEYKSRTIMSADKEHCIGLDNILIDDHESNVNCFGGNGILYPALWNKNYHLIDGIDKYIGQRLGEILE